MELIINILLSMWALFKILFATGLVVVVTIVLFIVSKRAFRWLLKMHTVFQYDDMKASIRMVKEDKKKYKKHIEKINEILNK